MRPTTPATGKENDMIKASIDDLELKISEREPLVAGTVGLNQIKLSFSDEWAIFTKQIDFTNEHSGESRRISADVGVVTVPWELLRDEGDITCYVRGIGSDGTLRLRTREANLGTVLGGDEENVPGTGTPTPDVCDDTAAKIGDLTQLETDEKSQLVGAINELKRQSHLGYLPVKLTDIQTSGSVFICTADKTFAEVEAAAEGGKAMICADLIDGLAMCALIDSGTQTDSGKRWMEFIGLFIENSIVTIRVYSDETWAFWLEGYVTEDELNAVKDQIGSLSNLATTDKSTVVAAINEVRTDIPAKTSQLENDSGFLDGEDVIEAQFVDIPTKLSELDDDVGYLTLDTLPKYDGSVTA